MDFTFEENIPSTMESEKPPETQRHEVPEEPSRISDSSYPIEKAEAEPNEKRRGKKPSIWEIIQGIGVIFAIFFGLAGYIQSRETRAETKLVDLKVRASALLGSPITLVETEDEHGYAALQTITEFTILNASPIRTASITNVRWTVSDLPDGNYAFIEQTQLSSSTTSYEKVNLPLNIAPGEARRFYDYTTIFLDKSSFDKVAKICEGGVENKKFMDINHIIADLEFQPFAMIVTAESKEFYSSGFVSNTYYKQIDL